MAYRTRTAWHLLWTVPIGVCLAIAPAFWGSLALCGVSGCSGAGYGVSYGATYEWMLAFVAAGALVAASIALVPWQRPAVRLLVGLLVGSAVCGGLVWHAVALRY